MKKMMMILLLLPCLLYAQQEPRNRYGIIAGYSLNTHTSDFKRLPDCPSCSPGYKEGSGSGLYGGIMMDIPLSTGLFLSGRLAYHDMSGTLRSTEKTTIIVGGIATDGAFEHTLESTLGIIGFEPSIGMTLFDNVRGNIGFSASYLLTKEYAQVETIVQPADFGTFLNPDGTDSRSRQRNIFSGTLQEANSILLFAPVISLSYLMPLNKEETFYLQPELRYSLGLSNIVNDQLVNSWKVHALAFGIGLSYSPRSTPPKQEKYFKDYRIDTVRVEKEIAANSYSRGMEKQSIETSENDAEILNTTIVRRIDTLFIKKNYALQGSIIALGIDAAGNEVQNPQFIIEEYISNRLDPLLPYVFFDDNSATLPQRYNKLNANEASTFSINSLFRSTTLELYYHLLNIIGKRMTEQTKATMTLVGCNADQGAEKGNEELSKNRASAVKNYLVKVWNIDETRIQIQSRNLPQKASTPLNEPDKIAENRRVEIYSDNPKIMEPIFIEKIDRSANPPTARFKISAQTDAPLVSWKVQSYQKVQTQYTFTQTGTAPMPAYIDWVLAQDQKTIPQSEEKLISELSVEDSKGNTKTIKANELNVTVKTVQEKRTEKLGDYEIERFSLILFDFDKSSIEGNNKGIIDFIKGRIKENSTTEILGYTDRTGNIDYNQKLSLSRASSVKQTLAKNDAVVTGVGSRELLFNNDIPEGRFYCRTVNVIVKTPVQ